jgi:GTP-dependent phosphoenolpyruvate carboxykinase
LVADVRQTLSFPCESHFEFLSAKDSLKTKGLKMKVLDIKTISEVDHLGWREAVPQICDDHVAFGDRLPNELATALNALESSLN